MLGKIVIAVLIMVIVGFVLTVLAAPLLDMVKAPPAVFLAGVFTAWGWPIGVVAGLWWFFTGGSMTFRDPRV